MQIKFKELMLHNFKSHQDLTVNFGERTAITGDNAKGKSSIGEAVSYLLYGTDALGSKLDPTPITYNADATTVTLLLNVDGKDLLLGRELKSKTTYYVNEVPKKATEFNEIVEQMFDKDLFMSLFNPNYFFTLHWEKQRSLVLQYITTPPNKEVFKALPKVQGDKLSKLVKKQSIKDLKALRKDKKTKLDKQYIAAQSRTKTLQEQLDEQAPTVPLESLQVELKRYDTKIKGFEKERDGAADKNKKFNDVNAKIHVLNDQIEISKEKWPRLKDEVVEDACQTCKRPFDEESLKAAEENKEQRKKAYKAEHKDIVDKRNELRETLKTLEYVDVSEQTDQVIKLENERHKIQQDISKHDQYESLKKQVDDAVKKEKETLESLNESIFIIDSIKAFHAKEAELQAEKVQGIFDNLSINLFKHLKNGEIKPNFEVEMDGKGYKKLSLSEGIRAGLELRDVLSEQSELIVPTFVDNAESITKFKEPNGQLVTSRVVAGKELEFVRDDANDK